MHRCFWPSTVLSAGGQRASLVELRDEDALLQEILATTRIVATEEVVLPTLVALLGFRVAANPCSYDFVRYRTPYSVQQIDAAMGRANVFGPTRSRGGATIRYANTSAADPAITARWRPSRPARVVRPERPLFSHA